MTLNEAENTEFIAAHLATPLGLAFSQAIVNQDFDAALKRNFFRICNPTALCKY